MRNFTDKQISDIIRDMKIIVDSREKKNAHIIDFLECSGIPYEIDKMDTGDYTFELPSHPEFGVDRKFLVERKNSLDEIAGNFTKDRDRFVREFERIGDRRMHLVIENATWKKLLNGSYRSKFHPKSFRASIITFCIRYDVPVWFVGIQESPDIIYSVLRYELMEFLKNT